jgi:hypothetical protein
MPYISESSLQKSFSRCSRKILCRFQLREIGSQDSVWMAQSCVWTPICVKKPNNSKLHPSGRHGNTFGHTSDFKKIPVFLHRHGVGRQLSPAQMPGQHRLDVEILDKEIVCIHSASIWMTGQHCSDAVLLWQLCADKVQPSEL